MLLCQREKGVWSVMGSTKYVCNPFKYTLKSQLSKRRRIMGNREQDQNNREQTSQRQEYILEMKPQLLVIYTEEKTIQKNQPIYPRKRLQLTIGKNLHQSINKLAPKHLLGKIAPDLKRKTKRIEMFRNRRYP